MPAKILIVDDERNIRESSIKLLQRRGYDVHGAESGEESLKLIMGEYYDLVLLDVLMPGMDGITVLRKATEMMPDIQVVMLTGHGTMDMAIEAMEYGALGFLRKPIDIDSLQNSINDALVRGTTKRENTRLKAMVPLFELNKELLSELDQGKLIDILIKTVKTELNPDNIEITIWDEEGRKIVNVNDGMGKNVADCFKDSEEMAKRAAETMQPLVVSRGDGTVFDAWRNIDTLNSGYDIYVPFINRCAVIGSLRLSKLPPHKPLSYSDLEFLFTLSGQWTVALVNARLYESLGRAHLEMEALLKRIINSTEDERLRISLELHDGPIQTIIAAQFAVQACRTLLDDKMSNVDKKLQSIGEFLLESTNTLRRIISDLHPPDLEKSGLVSAIQEYLGIIGDENSVKCHLKVKGNVVKLPYSTERGVYYIVREALNNIKKHAEATEVWVKIDFQDNSLGVSIRDNGKGFETKQEPCGNIYEHIGIRSMKERAKFLHGSIAIKSDPGDGTKVDLSIPVAAQVEHKA